MSKKNNVLTSDIIIETLKRSSLNTVLIEGVDDVEIYRTLESHLEIEDISFFECQGRNNLLKVFERRNELSDNLLFICDNDLWVIFGRPNEYVDERLLTTEGYSVENDIYLDGEDIIQKLLKKDEISLRDEIVKNICKWYAHEITLVQKNRAYDCKFSDVTILNTSVMQKFSRQFEEVFLLSRNYVEAEESIYNEIFDDFKSKLRGKYIFQIFEKIFQERPKKSVRYSKSQLFDLVLNFVLSESDSEKLFVKRKLEIEKFFSNK